jgi:cytochrome c biogenesis protein CcmG/thiol:disulfide interchange protein DsbE
MNQKDAAENAAGFLAELGNPYDAIGADANGRTSIDWGVYGVPETFLIDKAGVVRYKQIGPLTVEALQQKILPLVRQLQQ